MAEAFAALGIAANIFQFLELGFKATQTIISTYRSVDVNGLAEHNSDLALSASEFNEQCSKLKGDRDLATDVTLSDLLTRCIDTATRLSVEIDRIKVPESRRHRRRTKIRFAVIAYLKSSKIQGIHEDLADIREQICTKLQVLIYEHHRSLAKSVDSWSTAADDWNRATEQKLADMAQHFKNLLNSSREVGILSRTLETFVREGKSHWIIGAILKSLHFTQIKERQNEIPKAHRDTFKWIFGENSPGNFSNWLQKSSGIFWITGKPGSGKSTLMKFILGHETTKSLAKTWAGSKPLIIASHFFWFGGTKLQKSQEGLLRTLLFQILSNFPEIISEVCNDRFLGPFRYLESWSLEELSDAFERLQALPSLPCRIFILVDGLDEYSGQQGELTGFLHAVTKSPKIKVCCASRPWPEFRSAFSKSFGQIQIHKFTAEDMQLYIRGTLGQNERFKELQSARQVQAEELVDSISEKAEGVFFWVSLAVKSLIRGLGYSDGLETLQRRLSEFPPDLDQFFMRMIDSIEEVYKPQVRQVFSMLLMAKVPLPLVLFRARETRSKEMRRSTRKPILFDSEPVYNFAGPFLLEEEMRDPLEHQEQLLSRCRDLVQAWEIADLTHPFRIRIGFLHRTVIEFLQRQTACPWNFGSFTTLEWRLFARACLRVLPALATPGPNFRDFELWFLYILQETESPRGAPDDDALMILDEFHNATQIRRDRHHDTIGRLLAISRARILIQQNRLRQKSTANESLPFNPDQEISTLKGILSGSGYIQIGERPESILSDSIDLDLLEGLLEIDEVKTNILHQVWRWFVVELRDTPHKRPTNAYEACRIMIRNGSPRFTPESNDGERTPAIEVVRLFRVKRIFTEDQISRMTELFPPEDLDDQAPSKKERRRRKRLKYKEKKRGS